MAGSIEASVNFSRTVAKNAEAARSRHEAPLVDRQHLDLRLRRRRRHIEPCPRHLAPALPECYLADVLLVTRQCVDAQTGNGEGSERPARTQSFIRGHALACPRPSAIHSAHAGDVPARVRRPRGLRKHVLRRPCSPRHGCATRQTTSDVRASRRRQRRWHVPRATNGPR
jgi:hypothetical protein